MNKHKLWEMYDLRGRVWLSNFDEDAVHDALTSVDPAVVANAVSQANRWIYNRDSEKWDYGYRNAVEKTLREEYPEKFESRRLGFVRHVLASVATIAPEQVEELLEDY